MDYRFEVIQGSKAWRKDRFETVCDWRGVWGLTLTPPSSPKNIIGGTRSGAIIEAFEEFGFRCWAVTVWTNNGFAFLDFAIDTPLTIWEMLGQAITHAEQGQTGSRSTILREINGARS